MTDQGRDDQAMEPAGSTDRQSIEAFYRAEHDKLWRSLYAFTADADVASDAAAETVSQALRRQSEIRDPAAWIWRTAFKVAAGLLAGRSRHLELVADDADTVADAAEQESSMVEFLDLLKTLSDQQRAVVALRYAGGLTATDIAALLDTTPNTVRVQLHRAQAHLRERIELS